MLWWAYPARETLNTRERVLFYVGDKPVRLLVREYQRSDSRAI